MKQRDLELLSSYLDGQLSPADASRLEARLLLEPELQSVLRDLRSARSVLRKLPMRRAPRNFRLTPKMVGKNPPLPRAYPAFRLTSVLATLMLFITMGLNLVRPTLTFAPTGFGMGGGGAPESYSMESAPAAATEAPTLEAPMLAAEAPAATEAPAEDPSVSMAPMSTQSLAQSEDSARIVDTPAAKEGDVQNGAGGETEQVPSQAPVPVPAPVVPAIWQWILAGVAVLSVLAMWLMRQLSINHWQNKK